MDDAPITVRKYSDFDEMKADEYRYWQSRPAHERLDAVEEMVSAATKLASGRSQDLADPDAIRDPEPAIDNRPQDQAPNPDFGKSYCALRASGGTVGDGTMQMNGNTILITGGGSGIGKGLAEALHAAGNQVIIAGRRKQALDETARQHQGMRTADLDINSADAIRKFGEQIAKDFPALNVVIHNAGIARAEDVNKNSVDDAEAMVTTNLLGPIRLGAALMPTLLAQPRATIMLVSSGLAFVPLARSPTYCATKAAIHSYAQSLRYQLRKTSVQVIELAPPYVQTELGGEHQKTDPRAMPLADFISEVVSILKSSPEANEILVERVKEMRFAERNGAYDKLFQTMNDSMSDSMAASGRP